MVRCFQNPHFLWNFCEYPQISQSSQTYFLFGQCSLDAQLLHFNSIDILKGNISRKAILVEIFSTFLVHVIFEDQQILTTVHILVQTRLNQFEESINSDFSVHTIVIPIDNIKF